MLADISTFLKSKNKSQLKGAEKLVKSIREFEEVNKGRFIAFVDDGPDSFDISIELDSEGNISNMKCDCKSTSTTCDHILACLIYADRTGQNDKSIKPSPKKATKKIVRKKKLPKHIEMIQSVETSKILDWLATVIKDDKQLTLRFKKELIENDAVIDINSLTVDFAAMLKSIKGRRQRATVKECSEGIKIMKPIYFKLLDDQLAGKLHKPTSKELLNLVYAQVKELQWITATKSQRLVTLKNQLSEKYYHLIHMTKAAETEEAYALFSIFYTDSSFPLLVQTTGLFYFEHISKDRLLSSLKIHIEGFKRFNYDYHSKILVDFGVLFEKHEVLIPLLEHLPFIMYANDYNLFIMAYMINQKMYDKVIQSCELIFTKYQPQYAKLYYGIYHDTLSISGQHGKLKTVLQDMFLSNSTPEMYKRLMEMMNSEEKEVYFLKLLKTRSFNANDGLLIYRLEALMFFGQFKKVLDYFRKYSIMDLFERYVDVLRAQMPYETAAALFSQEESFYKLTPKLEKSVWEIVEQLSNKEIEKLSDVYYVSWPNKARLVEVLVGRKE